MDSFRIEKMILGMVRTNCYFLVNGDTKETILFDPADGAERIALKITQEGLLPKAVLLTHGHFDHIGAADALRKKYGIPVYLLSEETEIAENSQKNLSALWAEPQTVKADCLLRDGQVLEIAGFSIGVLHTPGHTVGSTCYYLPKEKVLFSGDTLFCESAGRTDFPTGSESSLVRSVRGLLASLPEDVRVLPGHEGETDIAHEKIYNPFA